jgi:hypothetical protein
LSTIEEDAQALTILNQEIDAMTRLRDERRQELAIRMIQEGKEAAYGVDGIGYTPYAPRKYVFSKAAHIEASEMGLLHLFQKEPEITKTKLDELVKNDTISPTEYGSMISLMQIEEGSYTTKKVVNKEMVVK